VNLLFAADAACSHIILLVPIIHILLDIVLHHFCNSGCSKAVSILVFGFMLDVQALYDCIASASCCVGFSVNQYIFLPSPAIVIPHSFNHHNHNHIAHAVAVILPIVDIHHSSSIGILTTGLSSIPLTYSNSLPQLR